MKKIGKMLSNNPRYRRIQKPLEAAKVCDVARTMARHRFEVISYKNGLLTVSVQSSAAAGNLQAESTEIIEKINRKIGESIVKKIRFRIV